MQRNGLIKIFSFFFFAFSHEHNTSFVLHAQTLISPPHSLFHSYHCNVRYGLKEGNLKKGSQSALEEHLLQSPCRLKTVIFKWLAAQKIPSQSQSGGTEAARKSYGCWSTVSMNAMTRNTHFKALVGLKLQRLRDAIDWCRADGKPWPRWKRQPRVGSAVCLYLWALKPNQCLQDGN